MNIGVGRAAFEAAVDYAKLRVQGAKPIIQHQAIGTILAKVATKLEVARNMVRNAAWAADHPEAYADRTLPDLPLQAIASVYAAEAMYEVVEDSAECFGAMGVMLDMPLPKYVHEARVFFHTGRSAAVENFRIAEAVAGYRRD
jgi:alkylation response protein AidB-like acyl-CoA dehydrogenase